jgi:DNA-binding CsgD family transcriptional regulator
MRDGSASGRPRRRPAEWRQARSVDLDQVVGLLHYPVVGLDREAVVRWATPSAARLLKRHGLSCAGESLLAPQFEARLPHKGATLRKWLSGDARATDFEWPSAAGESQKFVAVPLALSPASGAELAILMLPPAFGTAGADSPLRGATEEPAQLRALTARERQIASQLLAGSRTALISEELGISINTVRNHLKSIFRKLRVRSQADLVRTLRPRRARTATS